MPHRSQEYLEKVITAIREYQNDELLSDRELSLHAQMSPTMISKIKRGDTVPKLSTLRKLKDVGVDIPKPRREMMESREQHASSTSSKN